ncbi:MAG: tetratricopeptide repeat protein, partial [Armatimonadetes bacterium]|nr:tetratricopeptide repeat protein [Armatimonadota bacterium]
MRKLQPSFEDVFSDMVEFALRPQFADELARGVREFYGVSRVVDGNDLPFLEWFVFDRPVLDDASFVNHFLHSTARYTGREREEIASWADSSVSFYEVVGREVEGLRLRDILRARRRDRVVAASPHLGLHKGELIMARLLSWSGVQRLAGAVNVIPHSSRGDLRMLLEHVRGMLGGEDWDSVLKDVIPALARFQREVALEDEPLFPGGYPDRISALTVETFVAHGRSCLDRGEWTEALLCFQRALFEDPMHLMARNFVGLVHLTRGDTAAARKAFDSILRVDPHHCHALLNLGNVALAAGDVDTARGMLCLARAAAEDPMLRAHANLSLGLLQLADGTDAEALRMFAEAAALAERAEGEADALRLLQRIGATLSAAQMKEEALPYLKRLLRMSPEAGDIHLMLAEILVELERWRPAAAAYRRALRHGCGGGQAWNALGKCYLQVASFRAAERALRRSVELLPGLVEAHDNLGQAMLGQNRVE